VKGQKVRPPDALTTLQARGEGFCSKTSDACRVVATAMFGGTRDGQTVARVGHQLALPISVFRPSGTLEKHSINGRALERPPPIDRLMQRFPLCEETPEHVTSPEWLAGG
jgi:hypothetical protein